MTAERDPFVEARETAARAHLVIGAISARLAGTSYHYLQVAPGGIGVHAGWRHSFSNVAAHDTKRGKVTAFTDRSRRRLKSRARASDWQRALLVFVTLTWPGTFPLDPDEWYAKVRVWKQAVSRHYGMPVVLGRRSRRVWKPGKTTATGLWAREFQARGAPHYHIALALPRGTDLEEFRRWSALTWYRLIGAGDGDAECAHREACEGRCWWSFVGQDGARHCAHNGRCDGRDCRAYAQHLKVGHCKKARSAYELLGYLAKEIAKRKQKELPAWLVERERGAGRWWGIWNLPRADFPERLTRAEFHTLRRIGRALSWSQERRRAAAKNTPPHRTLHRSWTLQSFTTEDRSGRPWSLAQAMYGFMLYLRDEPPRWTYARWDDIAGVQLELEASP